MGYITGDELEALAATLGDNDYARYLHAVLHEQG